MSSSNDVINVLNFGARKESWEKVLKIESDIKRQQGWGRKGSR